MWNFVAEKQLFSLFFVGLAANVQLSEIPLLDINVSGLIQHTKTNGQWPPKYVQITVGSNSYASAM